VKQEDARSERRRKRAERLNEVNQQPTENQGGDEPAATSPNPTLDSLWPGTLLAVIGSVAAVLQSNTYLFGETVRNGLLDFVLIAQVPLLWFWCIACFRIRRILHNETSQERFSILTNALAVVMTSPVAPPLAHIFAGGIVGKAIEVFVSMPVYHMPESGIRKLLMVGVTVLQMLLVFLSIFGSCAYVLWGNVSLVSRITNFIFRKSAVAINPLLQQIFVAGGMAAPFVWYLFNMGRNASDSVYFTAQTIGFAVAFLALGELNEKLRLIEAGYPVSKQLPKGGAAPPAQPDKAADNLEKKIN
jgi:hypothetical protein